MAQNSETRISFSTLSATPSDIRRPWQVFAATNPTAERTAAFVQRAADVFGDGNVFASLHLARNSKTKKLGRRLQERNVTISDIDVPEVKKLSIATVQAVGNILIGRFDRATNHLGWALTNVGSGRAQRKKVKEGLEITAESEVQVVRTHAAELRTNRGKKMVDTLGNYQKRTGKNVMVVLEITADKQTPDDYLNFIQEQQEQLQQKGLQIGMDIDLGHIARTGMNANTFLENVMKNDRLRPLVRFVTFNQYLKGAKEAHARLDTNGLVDFIQAAQTIRQYASPSEPPIILLEPNPKDFDWLIDPTGGMKTLEKIHSVFESPESN